MKKEIKKKWIAALRSGKYKRGTGKLRTPYGGFCCLGVLCDIYLSTEWRKFPWNDISHRSEFYYGMNEDSIFLPSYVRKWAGLKSSDPDTPVGSLAKINDKPGTTFEKIADIIEKYL